MAFSLNNNYRIYTDSQDNDALLVSYKGTETYDTAAFYCPYVPLGITNATFPPMPMPERHIVIEDRYNQGGWWTGVAVLTVDGRGMTASQLEDIHVWCIEQWGAPQLAEMRGTWVKDRELIFVHDDRMLTELKMRWHGVVPGE